MLAAEHVTDVTWQLFLTSALAVKGALRRIEDGPHGAAATPCGGRVTSGLAAPCSRHGQPARFDPGLRPAVAQVHVVQCGGQNRAGATLGAPRRAGLQIAGWSAMFSHNARGVKR